GFCRCLVLRRSGSASRARRELLPFAASTALTPHRARSAGSDRADFPVLRSLRRFLMTRPALRTRQDRIRSRYQIPGAEVATLPNYFQTDYQISLRPNWIWRIEVMVRVMAAGPRGTLEWYRKTRFPGPSRFGRDPPAVLSASSGTWSSGE